MNVWNCASRLIFNLVGLGISDFLPGHDWARLGMIELAWASWMKIINPSSPE